MGKNTVKFPLATSTWDQSEQAALQRVIASGRYTMGAEVAAYEREFANYFGSRHAVMVNSGSSANLIAVAAAVANPDVDLNPGDEVIVPAVSWATTFYPIHQLGLTLRFVDVDIDTLNIDLGMVEDAISPKTRAVFAVNLLGNPVDYRRLAEICSAHSICLLEDNCESMGATLNGRYTGTFGLAGTFSTFFSHHISTMEGGVVVTNDEYTYEAMISLRAHGWTRELPSDNLIYPKSGDPFDDLFRFVLPGYNVRPLELSGAIGREQLKKLPSILEGRRSNAAIFAARVDGLAGFRIQKAIGSSSWFGFSLLLEEHLEGRRRDVVNALRLAGIECRPIVAGNFTKNPVMKRLRTAPLCELPSADKIHDNGLFVGNHHYPIPDEIDLLVDTLESFA